MHGTVVNDWPVGRSLKGLIRRKPLIASGCSDAIAQGSEFSELLP
jgi:hypothetical protein